MNKPAIDDDLGISRDACPFAGRGQECDIDMFISIEVICLARLSIGMEDSIDTVALLL